MFPNIQVSNKAALIFLLFFFIILACNTHITFWKDNTIFIIKKINRVSVSCNNLCSFSQNLFSKKKYNALVEMPGIEPGTSHMRSVRSTTELHPQVTINCFKIILHNIDILCYICKVSFFMLYSGHCIWKKIA